MWHAVGLLLESEDDIVEEMSLKFMFPTSNNQAKYKAFLVGLNLAEETRTRDERLKSGSQLVVSQIKGEY